MAKGKGVSQDTMKKVGRGIAKVIANGKGMAKGGKVKGC